MRKRSRAAGAGSRRRRQRCGVRRRNHRWLAEHRRPIRHVERDVAQLHRETAITFPYASISELEYGQKARKHYLTITCV